MAVLQLTLKTVCRSFLSMALGWGVGFIYYCLGCTLTWGHPTDVSAILFWSGIFIFLGWLLFTLPLLAILPPNHRLLQLPRYPIFNIFYALLAFLILCGWIGFWKEPFYLGYAAIVGGIAGTAFAARGSYSVSRKNS